MGEKSLAELTPAELDRTMKMTGLAGIVVTVAIVVALGYAVFGLLEDPIEVQTSFTMIFVGIVLLGVFNLMVTMSNQYLRLRRDLLEVLHALREEG